MFNRARKKKIAREQNFTTQNISPINNIPYGSPLSPLDSNLSFSQRTYNSELYSTVSSIRDIVSSYKNPLNSPTVPDIQFQYLNPHINQLGSSPTKLNNSFENKLNLNSLSQTSINNLSSTIFKFSPNTNDRSRLPDPSKFKQAEKSDRSISVMNQDFFINSSLNSLSHHHL